MGNCRRECRAPRPQHRLGAVGRAEPAHDVPDMHLDRTLLGAERAGDLLVGLALAQQPQHGELAAWPPGDGMGLAVGGVGGRARMAQIGQRRCGKVGGAGQDQPQGFDGDRRLGVARDEAARAVPERRHHLGQHLVVRQHHNGDSTACGYELLEQPDGRESLSELPPTLTITQPISGVAEAIHAANSATLANDLAVFVIELRRKSTVLVRRSGSSSISAMVGCDCRLGAAGCLLFIDECTG